mmetsp:Transcript_24989/g.30532  ORF Transcript_24989/g.30532 Transcript_24989/m.30532 type:complete len:115 (+) Transcript_24989:152-496(+)
MGQNNSIGRYSNDFELVIRASKELEYLLETHFQAPSGKEYGIHEKISLAQHEGAPLSSNIVRQMRYLITIRNRIVHERDFNCIPERQSFVQTFDKIETELKDLIPDANKNCVIS